MPAQKQNKNTQTQSPADRISTSLSLAHQRKNKETNKKFSRNLTLYEAYTNHWTNLRRAETKWKKEFNVEPWEKETSNTISFLKTYQKAENYYANEGTNYKYISPNK